MTTAEPPRFDLGAAALPRGRLVLEASAGTGKTYSLSGLVVRHVAERGIAASELLVVTFTRAAAAELRDRTRRKLVVALHALETGDVPPEEPWMEVLLTPGAERPARIARVAEAISTFDDATITTIHGFCEQTLRRLGLHSGIQPGAELVQDNADLVDEVCRDLIVAELADEPDALAWKDAVGKPDSVLEWLKQLVLAVLNNPGARAVPHDLTQVSKPGPDSDDRARLQRWVELVPRAIHEIQQRRRQRRALDFDDLITTMARAAKEPVIAEELRKRYPLALLDEFQDTDPVQWAIFRQVFTGDLVTVGDPKQAIYRFRGADVDAYLDAVHEPDNGATEYQLGTNFRSDRNLVQATNALLGGMQLGDPRIAVTSVDARADAESQRLPVGAPLQIRRLPNPDDWQTTRGLSVPRARQAIVADLVTQVIHLLRGQELIASDGTHRPVGPGDIAVLVPSHAGGADVAAALAAAGVPAVQARTGSVLESTAAGHWRRFIAALESPFHGPTVRAAGLDPFLHSTVDQLDPVTSGGGAERDDAAGDPAVSDHVTELQQRCARWADELQRRSFLSWYDLVRAESGLVAHVLAQPRGERLLTDLDHIAELLATELPGRGAVPALAARALAALAEAAATAEADPQMRRIESDEQAVQISTIHASKGLEYPIVLLPLSWTRTRNDGPRVYRDPTRGCRVIDVAHHDAWVEAGELGGQGARKYLAQVEARKDALRLLYVALTRAKHRTIVWWAPARAPRSALNAVLFDRDETGAPGNTPDTFDIGPRGGFKDRSAQIQGPTDDDEAQARLELLVRRGGGTISVHECPIEAEPSVWAPPSDGATPVELSIAHAGDRKLADPAWRRWSFSSIKKTGTREFAAGLLEDVPVAGGTDEPDDNDDDPMITPPVPSATSGIPMPWADIVAGTTFGSLVHEVLELVDPQAPSLRDALDTAARAQLRYYRIEIDRPTLVDGLLAAMETPLGSIASGRRLCDIGTHDRLTEVAFEAPLAPLPSGGRVTVAEIGNVLHQHLNPNDPQRDYAELLAKRHFEVDLAGYLLGSIDAVLRCTADDGTPRFIVVDYKTNRLHERGAADPFAAYHPDQLPAAMAHHHYTLQALLYQVAVHRYLRVRLPHYDPAMHLGGIAYLFVRAMVGAETPTADGRPYGVFAWQPPTAAVEALDELLHPGQQP